MGATEAQPTASVRAIPRHRIWMTVLLELLILVSTFLSMFISNLAIQAWYPFEILRAMAITNATNIVAVEKALHFFWERPMQEWALKTFGEGRAWWWWNTYYAGVHAAVTVTCMVLLLVRMLWWDAGLARRFTLFRDTMRGSNSAAARRGSREIKERREPHQQYFYLRTIFVISTAISTLGYILLPTMPPRLLNYCEENIDPTQSEGACLQEYTYVDTIRVSGSLFWTWKDVKKSANPYAAFPSVHTLWSCFVAYVWISIYGKYVHRQDRVASIWTIVRHQCMRFVAVLYPAITVYCIIITANHYIIDAIGGLVILFVSIWLSSWYQARRGKRRIRTVQLTISTHSSGDDLDLDDLEDGEDEAMNMTYVKPMQSDSRNDVFMA